ncbi:MAG: CPBP family intramembrane metalloprotease [Deltaproteobacteria bacterium]|nr:MAG: CPBP family intramembrane metalloprotease [Deltaproteobacteria bacterium]
MFPGGGHFYLGESREGIIYLGSELSLAGAGYYLNSSLEKEPREELNLLYILAIKEHELGIFTAYRNARLDIENQGYPVPFDSSPISELFLSPFRFINLSSPAVFGFALSGIAIAYGEWLVNKPNKGFDQISDVYVMGNRINRNPGFSTYEALLFSISLSAAVGEEAAWRGVVQTEYERIFGRVKGLVAASLMFGLSHMLNPNITNRYWEAGVASVGGIYLGWVYQRDGYRLSKSVAAHFWYNILAGTTAFILDPENNPLGIRVEFNF